MKIATIVGARPQFVKAAVVSRALAGVHDEYLIHTGQHYDDNMSAVFFRDLGIPAPRYTFSLGGGSHGAQTGAMLRDIETALIESAPDAVLVYGDTNSTLAGALAAAKLHIPIAHVEAGLRSFNRRMPEEVNRVLTDHVSHWLFAPSAVSARNLEREGIDSGIHVVGDVMLDVAKETLARMNSTEMPHNLDLTEHEYVVATIHRAETTDSHALLARMANQLRALNFTVVMPLHPRTANRLSQASIALPNNVISVPPLSYEQMLKLVSKARLTITDSGGLQKEAYFLGCPCVTYRPETEWVETVETGWNVLCDPSTGDLLEAVKRAEGIRTSARPSLYGDGDAASRIALALTRGP